MILAVTGGTGFVGGHLIDLALARGHDVRALTRRPQPPREGVEWIDGALDRPDSLARLCEGAEAVIHVAGVVNGDAEAFRRGNVDGTEAMIAAAGGAGIKRFVQVSSLSAREPRISIYGETKCAAETPVRGFPGDWTIVRPPAVYGPGDRDMLEFFRIARSGVMPLPPRGRLSLIHVDDLAALLLACLDASGSFGETYEPDDGVRDGWTHREFARAIGDAVGRKVLPLSLPKPVLAAGAMLDGLFRGRRARLTRDRVAYFCHPDWVSSPDAAPPASLWRAAIDSRVGLAQTAAWYRARGWLKP